MVVRLRVRKYQQTIGDVPNKAASKLNHKVTGDLKLTACGSRQRGRRSALHQYHGHLSSKVKAKNSSMSVQTSGKRAGPRGEPVKRSLQDAGQTGCVVHTGSLVVRGEDKHDSREGGECHLLGKQTPFN